jgi:chemotaxis protein MotB
MRGSTSAIRHDGAIGPAFAAAIAAATFAALVALVVFAGSQFFLADAFSGQGSSVGELNRRIGALAAELEAERKKLAAADKVNHDLDAVIQSVSGARDRLASERTELTARLGTLDGERKELAGRLQAMTEAHAAMKKGREDAEARGRALEAELKSVKNQIAALESRQGLEEYRRQVRASLEATEKDLAASKSLADSRAQEIARRDGEIASLKAVIAANDTTIEAQRRRQAQIAAAFGEFQKKVREIFPEKGAVDAAEGRVILFGDEVYEFAAERLKKTSRERMGELALAIKTLGESLPAGTQWVLRVNGHTDNRIKRFPRFYTVWEFAAARSATMVKALIDAGVPSERLLSASYGELHLIEKDDAAALVKRNDRIELVLDAR